MFKKEFFYFFLTTFLTAWNIGRDLSFDYYHFNDEEPSQAVHSTSSKKMLGYGRGTHEKEHSKLSMQMGSRPFYTGEVHEMIEKTGGVVPGGLSSDPYKGASSLPSYKQDTSVQDSSFESSSKENEDWDLDALLALFDDIDGW